MKKLRLIVLILSVSILLTGCRIFFSFSLPDASDTTKELPIGSEVPSHISAEDIYWRCKFAATDRALQYTTESITELTFSEDDMEFSMDMHYDTQITMDPDTCAVNLQTLVSFDDEEPDVYWEYYRNEDGNLALYYYKEQTGYCSREVIDLDGKTPYAVILDFSCYGYPYDPQELTMEPQTRILDDREVYVLTFNQTALDAIGYTGNSVRDSKLSQRSIPTTWYVDAQTNLPVQISYTLTQVDDLLGDVIASIYQFSEEDLGATITGFSYTVKDMVFDPVEVPPVPNDVQRKAWSNAGFSPS